MNKVLTFTVLPTTIFFFLLIFLWMWLRPCMHEKYVSKFLKKMQEKNVYILCLTICCLNFETFAFIVGILIPQSLHMKGACFVLLSMLFNHHPVMKMKVWLTPSMQCLNVLLSPETMVGLSFYIYALFVLK